MAKSQRPVGMDKLSSSDVDFNSKPFIKSLRNEQMSRLNIDH